jgi:prepilin-type processing-associated H-X9-DG protein
VFLFANDNNTTWNTNMADILDGTSTTISVGEVSISDPAFVGSGKTDDQAYPIWAGGNDAGDCGNAVYGLGSFLRMVDVDFYINRRIGQQSTLAFGSMHPGGAQFVFVDGSTHFLSQDVDPVLYRGLGSRNGGEAVSVP